MEKADRQEQEREIIRLAREGLGREQIMEKLGLPEWPVRKALEAGRKDGRLPKVPKGGKPPVVGGDEKKETKKAAPAAGPTPEPGSLETGKRTSQDKGDYEFHPFADLFPLMDAAALDELAADIEKHGLEDEITLCEGKILDGRNRYLACKKAGRKPEFRNFTYKGGTDILLDYVLSKNLHRRHLTAEQKRAVVATVLKARPGQTNRQAAAKTGTDHKTVAGVRKDLESRGEIPHVETRTDTKGRKQPARKKPKAEAKAIPEQTPQPTSEPAAPAPQEPSAESSPPVAPPSDPVPPATVTPAAVTPMVETSTVGKHACSVQEGTEPTPATDPVAGPITVPDGTKEKLDLIPETASPQWSVFGDIAEIRRLVGRLKHRWVSESDREEVKRTLRELVSEI